MSATIGLSSEAKLDDSDVKSILEDNRGCLTFDTADLSVSHFQRNSVSKAD